LGLSRLEGLIFRAVEQIGQLQTERTRLREQVDKLRQHLEELEKDNQTKRSLINQLQSDRLEVRSRAERIREKIADLERSSQAPML
jgi:ribosomal protein S15P/S13E